MCTDFNCKLGLRTHHRATQIKPAIQRQLPLGHCAAANATGNPSQTSLKTVAGSGCRHLNRGKHGEDNTHSQPHACVCPTPCSPTSDADGGDRPCAPKVTAPHRNRDSLQFTSPLIGRVQFAQIIGQQNGNIFKKRKLPPLSPSVFPKPNRTSWLS